MKFEFDPLEGTSQLQFELLRSDERATGRATQGVEERGNEEEEEEERQDARGKREQTAGKHREERAPANATAPPAAMAENPPSSPLQRRREMCAHSLCK